MKKKILALTMIFCLVGVAVLSGTLAYFTDSEQATNVFTVGKIDITLTEDTSVLDKDGNDIPGKMTETANGVYYSNIMPTNYLEKKVTITNNENPAYVRVVVVLNNSKEITAAVDNYTEVFDGWGLADDGSLVKNANELTHVDDINVGITSDNWYTYDNNTIGTNERAYVYYLYMGTGDKVTLFNGIKCPEDFTQEQAKMFDNLKIEVYADAIQAESFAVAGAETATASADPAFKALEAAHHFSSIRTPSTTLVEINSVEGLKYAAATGGTYALTADIALTEALEIPEEAVLTLDLGGKKITSNIAKDVSAVIENEGTLSIVGGTLENTCVNGGAIISNSGDLTLDDVTIKGAPMDSTGYPEYAVTTSGKLVIEDGTEILADRGAVRTSAGADVTINGGEFIVSNAADGRNMTLHTVYAYGSGTKLTINDGKFEMNHSSTGGASVICPAGATITINGGTFNDSMDDNIWTSTGNFQNYMGYSAPVNVYGGTYDDKTVEKWIADGYQAADNGDGTWSVVMAQGAFNTAINEGGEIELPAGTFEMPSTNTTDAITIKGTTATVIDNTLGSYLEKATVSFEGVTIKGSTGKVNGNGSDYAALYSPNVTYTDCTFDGPFRIGRDGAKFINCKFTNLGNDYVWTYGNDVTFEGCTFETDGKAILVYSDGGNEVSKVTVNGCKFYATQGAQSSAISNMNVAAIEIHNYGNGVDLVTSGNEILSSYFSGEWRIKEYVSGNPAVIVNGVTYTQTALDGTLFTVTNKVASFN